LTENEVYILETTDEKFVKNVIVIAIGKVSSCLKSTNVIIIKSFTKEVLITF
jgi:hypothetical protein